MVWTADSVIITADNPTFTADGFGSESGDSGYLDVAAIVELAVEFDPPPDLEVGYFANQADFTYLAVEIMHSSSEVSGADFTFLLLELMHSSLTTPSDVSAILDLSIETIAIPQFPIEMEAVIDLSTEIIAFVGASSFSADTAAIIDLAAEVVGFNTELEYNDVEAVIEAATSIRANNFIAGSASSGDVLEVLIN